MNKHQLLDLVDDYLIEEKLDEKEKSTIKHYSHVIKLFINSLQNEDISKKDLMDFKALLMDRYKPKTVSNYIVIVNKFIKYAEIKSNDEDHEDFDFNKLKKYYSKQTLKNIKIQQESSLSEVLEPDELKRMLRMAKKTDYEIYLIMKTLAFTGIRIAELKYFTVENLRSNYISVRNKGKIRDIILRQDLRKELLDYCASVGITNGYLFRGRKNGTMIHHTTTYKRMKRIAGMCRGIELKKIHPHSFRHLFAIKFMEDGGDIAELADILGHGSIETTRIYVRSTNKMKRKRLEKMKY